MFEISTVNGFLPIVAPLRSLPTEFAALEDIMTRLPDLLHAEDPDSLGSAIRALPQYDIPADASATLKQALMRDYSILVSAYLLEGKTKAAAGGTIRTRVPANIAKPFAEVCARVDEQMIMSYDSYCLSNCYEIHAATPRPSRDTDSEPVRGYEHWEWENLRLVRAFDGGPEEATFILIHSEIESHTPHLIRAYDVIIQAARARDIELVKSGLRMLREVMQRIIVSQLKMFNASDPRNYEKFVRPWIFGWRGNPDFPEGVVFEGVNGDAPTQLRGETGAQSTIIPSIDVILGITHKEDMLRRMLTELEAYRPKPHRDFLGQLREIMWGRDIGPDGVPIVGGAAASASGATGAPALSHLLRDFLMSAKDVEAIKLFNECVAHVWAFRDIHVTFSEAYIARYSKKEMATGGTPYKAYLRKHRDESMAHQITEFGEQYLHRFDVPKFEVFNAEIDAILSDSTPNGIPAHLLSRHASIIARYGRGAASLKEKRFPKHGEISKR